MKYYNKKDINKIIVLIVITIVLLSWALVNADGFILPAFMYIVLGGLSIAGYLLFNKIGTKSYIFGVDRNMGTDFLIGLGFGLGFILLQTFNIIGSILVPYIPASLVQESGRIIIIVIGAMVIETTFFLGLGVPFVDEKLKDFGIDPPFLVALFIVSFFVATVFHATSYGQVGATAGSYISAGIFFFFSGLVMYKTKSLLPLIISHGMINFYILNQTYHYINFGINQVILPLINNIIPLIHIFIPLV